MTFQRTCRCVTLMLSAVIVLEGFSAYAQHEESNVPRGIQISKDIGRESASAEINITVHLKLNDKAAFDKAVDALYDPASPTFHKWMSDADLRKYAPAEKQRQIVRQELEKHGLVVLSTDKFGFTIRARGTSANVESGFNTEIHQFEYNGNTYRANVRNARLIGEAGDYVATVAGIESHPVQPLAVRSFNSRVPPVELSEQTKNNGFPSGSTTDCLSAPASYKLGGSKHLPHAVYSGTAYVLSEAALTCDYLPNQLWTALGLNEVYAAGYNGAGQTIVLVEAYGYPTPEKDANAFSNDGESASAQFLELQHRLS